MGGRIDALEFVDVVRTFRLEEMEQGIFCLARSGGQRVCLDPVACRQQNEVREEASSPGGGHPPVRYATQDRLARVDGTRAVVRAHENETARVVNGRGRIHARQISGDPKSV